MSNILSLLTYRAWLKPREVAPQLATHLNFGTVATLYLVIISVSAFISQQQASTPFHIALGNHILYVIIFIILARWPTQMTWAALLKVALLGSSVMTPLNLLPSIIVESFSVDESENLGFLTVMVLLLSTLLIWMLTVRVRLYSTLLALRKRTVFTIVALAFLITLGINFPSALAEIAATR